MLSRNDLKAKNGPRCTLSQQHGGNLTSLGNGYVIVFFLEASSSIGLL